MSRQLTLAVSTTTVSLLVICVVVATQFPEVGIGLVFLAMVAYVARVAFGRANLVAPEVIVAGLFGLYVVFPLLESWEVLEQTDKLPQLVFLTGSALVGFLAGVASSTRLGPKRRLWARRYVYGTRLIALLVLLVAAGTAAQIALIRYAGGWNYFTVSRSARSLIHQAVPELSVSPQFFRIATLLGTIGWLRARNPWLLAVAAYATLCNLAISVLTLSRAILVETAVPLVVATCWVRRRVAKPLIAIGGSAFLLIMLLWKPVLGGAVMQYLGVERSIHLALDTGELLTPTRTLVDIVTDVPREYPFLWGRSYLNAIVGLLPSRLLPWEVENLSRWYVRTYYPDTWQSGGGRGFSQIAEAYMNFGLLGPAVVFFIAGWHLRRVSLSATSGDDIGIAMGGIASSLAYRLFRSDSLSVLNSYFLFGYIPIWALWMLSGRRVRMLRTENEAPAVRSQ